MKSIRVYLDLETNLSAGSVSDRINKSLRGSCTIHNQHIGEPDWDDILAMHIDRLSKKALRKIQTELSAKKMWDRINRLKGADK